jgi:hypothetical protein
MGFGKFSTHLPNYKTRKSIMSTIQVSGLKIADRTSTPSEFSAVIQNRNSTFKQKQEGQIMRKFITPIAITMLLGLLSPLAATAGNNDFGYLFVGGKPGPVDKFGDSTNAKVPEVKKLIADTVAKNFSSYPANLQKFFLDRNKGKLASAKKDLANIVIAEVKKETGGSFSPYKLPSYWESIGPGTGAGVTQTKGMKADPKGMTYGMTSAFEINPSRGNTLTYNPIAAVNAYVNNLGHNMANLNKSHPASQAAFSAANKYMNETELDSLPPVG